MKILITIWLSAITTFAITSSYILLNEKNINVPGELSENFFAAGFFVLLALALVNVVFVVITFIESKKKSSR